MNMMFPDGKFLQRFGFGNVDESVRNDSARWELTDRLCAMGDGFISLHPLGGIHWRCSMGFGVSFVGEDSWPMVKS